MNNLIMETAQVLDEFGTVDYCDHAGATLETVLIQDMAYDSDSNTIHPDGATKFVTLVCDKKNCDAWQLPSGEWSN